MTYPSHWMRAYGDAGEWQYERVEKKYWGSKGPHRQKELLPDGSVVPEDMHTGEAMAAYVDRCLGRDAARVASIIMSTGYRPRVTTLRRRLGDALYTRMAETGLLYVDGATERAQATPHVAIEYWAARHCEEVDL